MAKAITLTQVGYNGQSMMESQVGLNTSLIYNIEDGDVSARIFYKNADGTVLNIVDVTDLVGDILNGMNAGNPNDVTMISVYDTSGNLVLIPYSSFLMVSEVNDGGSIITYVNGTTIANTRVNNSVASVVGMFNAAVGQYDSGQITIDTTTAPNTNYYVSAIDNTFKSTITYYSSMNTSDSLNKPNIFYGFDNEVWFRPSIPWAGVTKVTVYTNATAAGDMPFNFEVAYGYSKEYYVPGTTTQIIDYNSGAGDLGDPVYSAVDLLVPGVAPTNPNAGDAGTYYGEVTYTGYPGTSAGPWSSGFVGNVFKSTGTFNIPTPTLADYWQCSMISFQFKTKIADPNFKFRIVIDYI